jgi:hypothetical protein
MVYPSRLDSEERSISFSRSRSKGHYSHHSHGTITIKDTIQEGILGKIMRLLTLQGDIPFT